MMNPDGFSHFNGPIIVGVVWGVATGRTNMNFKQCVYIKISVVDDRCNS